jgi:hypothetical protein
MMKQLAKLAVAPLFLLAGCGGADVGSVSQASHAWSTYHWARTSNPFTLRLADNVSSAWDSYLATSSSDWTQSTVLNTTIVAGSNTKNCRAVTGRVEVCNAAYGFNGWLGLASISLSGGHIAAGTVKLNDSYFNSATYNTPAWRNLVMCQEIGHTFGLTHNDEDFNTTNGTCMDYSNDPVPNQHPNAHDYEQLQIIYSHVDSTTTVGLVAPSTAPSLNGNAPEEWGALVSSRGPMATYVRELGNGNAVVTEVFWAPSESEEHTH